MVALPSPTTVPRRSTPGVTSSGRLPCPLDGPRASCDRPRAGASLRWSRPPAHRWHSGGSMACRRTYHLAYTSRRSQLARDRSRAWARRWPPSSGWHREALSNGAVLITNWSQFVQTFGEPDGGFVPGTLRVRVLPQRRRDLLRGPRRRRSAADPFSRGDPHAQGQGCALASRSGLLSPDLGGTRSVSRSRMRPSRARTRARTRSSSSSERLGSRTRCTTTSPPSVARTG